MTGRPSLDPDGLDGLFGPREAGVRNVSALDGEGPLTARPAPMPSRIPHRAVIWRSVVVACVVTALFVAYRSLRREAVTADRSVAANAATASGLSSQSPLPTAQSAGPGQPEARKTVPTNQGQGLAKALTPRLPDKPQVEASQATAEETQPARAKSSPNTEIASPVSQAASDANLKTPAFTQRFRFNSLSLKGLATAERSNLVAYARGCEGLIRVVGHTCSVGSEEANQRLGLARARAVRDLLRSEGLAGRTILIESAGASQPVAPNDSERGRADNRRAEVYCPAGAVPSAQHGSPEGEARP